MVAAQAAQQKTSDIMTLSDFLRREFDRRGWSLHDAERYTGISRPALTNILDHPEVVPKLVTLDALARVLGIPLWRMVELVGFQSGMPTTIPMSVIQRSVALAQAMPELEDILNRLLRLPPSDMKAILLYLEILEAMEQRTRRNEADEQ